MKFPDIELPTNRRFGFFFTFVFFGVFVYMMHLGKFGFGYVSLLIAMVLISISLIKANLLLPFNRLWMRFGSILGMIVSPIVLGVIFFGIFTPIGIVMHAFKRDELRLRLKDKTTHWILRETPNVQRNSFKQQF